MGQIKALCHRYGAFLSLHFGSHFLPRLRDGQYRYAYIGECVPHLERLRENGRDYDPLVLFIPDWRFVPCDKEPEAQYAASIPHGMFPVLYGGVEVCPWWGAQKLVDEVVARERCSAAEARAAIEGRYFKYLGAMNRMIAHDAVLFSDIQGDFRLYDRLDPAFPRLTASLYINEEFHLVLANDGAESVTASLVSPFEDVIRGGVSTETRIAPGGLAILKRIANAPFRVAEQQRDWTPDNNPFLH